MSTRSITIQPVLNGFVCGIGCQQVIFTSVAQLQTEIGRYYTDPVAVEREYRNKAVNPMEGPPPECAGGVAPPVGINQLGHQVDSGRNEQADPARRSR